MIGRISPVISQIHRLVGTGLADIVDRVLPDPEVATADLGLHAYDSTHLVGSLRGRIEDRPGPFVRLKVLNAGNSLIVNGSCAGFFA
jgi:hypothetical protein